MGKCGIGVKIGDDMNRQLLHRLGGIFDTHQILASDLYREIYSRDGSYFDIKPEIIVRPDTPQQDRKSTRLNSSHKVQSRMPSSA